MPPAARKACDYPGCNLGPPDDQGVRGPYLTSLDKTKRDEVVEDLKNHMEMTHLLPIRLAEDETKKMEARANALLAEAKKLEEENIANRVNQTLEDEIDPDPQQHTQHTSAARKFNDKRDHIPRPKLEEN